MINQKNITTIFRFKRFSVTWPGRLDMSIPVRVCLLKPKSNLSSVMTRMGLAHRMPLRWSNACTMEVGCSDINATSSCRTSIRLSSCSRETHERSNKLMIIHINTTHQRDSTPWDRNDCFFYYFLYNRWNN